MRKFNALLVDPLKVILKVQRSTFVNKFSPDSYWTHRAIVIRISDWFPVNIRSPQTDLRGCVVRLYSFNVAKIGSVRGENMREGPEVTITNLTRGVIYWYVVLNIFWGNAI